MPATMCLVLLLLWLSPVAPNQETGSCSQPQPLCCLGTDHHCKRGSCYCDEFCHVASDCCPDHRALCDPASQNTKMVLRVVLRMEKPPGPARRHLGWMQSIVSALEVPQKGWRHPAPASLASRPQSQGTTTKQVQHLLQSSLPGMPLSISVKGIKKRA